MGIPVRIVTDEEIAVKEKIERESTKIAIILFGIVMAILVIGLSIACLVNLWVG